MLQKILRIWGSDIKLLLSRGLWYKINRKLYKSYLPSAPGNLRSFGLGGAGATGGGGGGGGPATEIMGNRFKSCDKLSFHFFVGKHGKLQLQTLTLLRMWNVVVVDLALVIVVGGVVLPVPVLEEPLHEPGPPLPGPGVQLMAGLQVRHHLAHHRYQAVVHLNLETGIIHKCITLRLALNIGRVRLFCNGMSMKIAKLAMRMRGSWVSFSL